MKKLIVFLLIPFMGCVHRPSSNNPQVILANDLNSAAQVVDLVADALVTADQVVEQLKTTEAEYYMKAKPTLQKLAHLNDTAIQAISAAKGGSTADWRSAILAISKGFQATDLTVFGFKNPNTQGVVKIGMASLISVMQSIQISFGGAQ